METQDDSRELPALLNKHGVEYLVVGGYALAFHGAPRFTGDLDLLVRAAPENARAGIVDNFFSRVLGGILGRFFGTHRPWR